MAWISDSGGGFSGGFTLDNIPPGEYRMLALEVAGMDDGSPWWELPEFLRRYELRGERITVDPNLSLANYEFKPQSVDISSLCDCRCHG